jgi:hypothetical protein
MAIDCKKNDKYSYYNQLRILNSMRVKKISLKEVMEKRRMKSELIDVVNKALSGISSECRVVFRSSCPCCTLCSLHQLVPWVEERRLDGAVYWSEQDEEEYCETGELFVRFFIIKEGLKLGEKIKEILERHGIEVSWDGNYRQVITVKGFK